jgi:hypothetical protein
MEMRGELEDSESAICLITGNETGREVRGRAGRLIWGDLDWEEAMRLLLVLFSYDVCSYF